MGFRNTFGNIRKANDSARTDWEHRRETTGTSLGPFIVASDARHAVAIATQDRQSPPTTESGTSLQDWFVVQIMYRTLIGDVNRDQRLAGTNPHHAGVRSLFTGTKGELTSG
jgi:hypothetical protein